MQKASKDFEKDARNLSCGPEASFCQGSLKSSFQDTFRSDACFLETQAASNEEQFDYNMWQPAYASQLSRGSAFLNASVDANRFAPKQVSQESFLQGRGQVSSNPGCKGSSLIYLPAEAFSSPPPEKKEPWDMHLFAQPTLVPRACASVTELDIIDRMKPRAHAFQERYTSLKRPQIKEGVTLSSKRYPDFAEQARKSRYEGL